MTMRFIQVGVNQGAPTRWRQALKRHPRVKVVGLVDVDPAALDEACRTEGFDPGICYGSLDEALKHVEADALMCVTPPEFHCHYAVKAMKAGLHVMTEKPMASTPAECRRMLRTSIDTGKVCLVTQNYRYQGPMRTLADEIRRGRIGRVGQVSVEFFKGMNFGGFRGAMEYPLLVDMAIHHFDLIRYITRQEPVSVIGAAWNPPWSHFKGDCSNSLVFEMNGGARVVYNGSWCAQGDYSRWAGDWHIEGMKGTLEYRGREDIVLHRAPRVYTVKETRPIPTRTMKTAGDAFMINDFMRAVKRGGRARTDVFDNIYSISMVFAAVKAVRTGRRVPVMSKTLRELAAARD